MKYAVTGVTGKLGKIIIDELQSLVSVEQIIAIGRDIKKLQMLVPDGIEIRQGDYTNFDSMVDALSGVDRLLFVSSQPGGNISRLEQHKNVVQAAKKVGVKWIGYTSFPDADKSIASLALDHQKTEKLILESGLSYSFLRNNWYLENELTLIKDGLDGQPFVYAGGSGKVGWALEVDYAKAAARVLVTKKTKLIYEFSGEPHTYAELALAVSELSSKKFTVESLSIESYHTQLIEKGLDEQTVMVLVMLQQLIRDNQLAKTTNDLSVVLNRPAPSLKTMLKTIIND